MTRLQARLKPEHRLLYPSLNSITWYEVTPLFPGVTARTLNMAGERLTRLKTAHDYATVHAEHLEFRSKPDTKEG